MHPDQDLSLTTNGPQNVGEVALRVPSSVFLTGLQVGDQIGAWGTIGSLYTGPMSPGKSSPEAQVEPLYMLKNENIATAGRVC